MGKVTMKIDDWQKEMAERQTPEQEALIIGPSPGGAAGKLGVTRQRVHQLIKQGRLDAIEITDREGGLLAVMITNESLERYKREREENSSFYRGTRMKKK